MKVFPHTLQLTSYMVFILYAMPLWADINLAYCNRSRGSHSELSNVFSRYDVWVYFSLFNTGWPWLPDNKGPCLLNRADKMHIKTLEYI